MKQIERAPFTGKSERIGTPNSCDSVVMRLEGSPHYPQGTIVKWNKREISSPDEARQIIMHLRKSIALYESALGQEHIVPTELVIGEKKDNDHRKIKVYTVQPYISGWNGRTLPEDLRTNDRIVTQWRSLYSRLAMMFVVGRSVNERFEQEGKTPFPIEMTVGTSRKFAITGRSSEAITSLPATQNILINREGFGLVLCDFGAYTPWQDAMQPAYDEICNRTLQAVGSLQGAYPPPSGEYTGHSPDAYS